MRVESPHYLLRTAQNPEVGGKCWGESEEVLPGYHGPASFSEEQCWIVKRGLLSNTTAGLRSPQEIACIWFGAGWGSTRGWLPKPNIRSDQVLLQFQIGSSPGPMFRGWPSWSGVPPSLLLFFRGQPESGLCPAPHGELPVAGHVESVRQGTLCFTNLEPVVCCEVGEWMTSWFLSVSLCDHFAFVEYVYIITLWLFCLGELQRLDMYQMGPTWKDHPELCHVTGPQEKPPLKWGRRRRHQTGLLQFPKSLP